MPRRACDVCRMALAARMAMFSQDTKKEDGGASPSGEMPILGWCVDRVQVGMEVGGWEDAGLCGRFSKLPLLRNIRLFAHMCKQRNG